MHSPDLLKRIAEPLQAALRAALSARGLDRSMVAALSELLDAALLVLVAMAVVRVAAALGSALTAGAENPGERDGRARALLAAAWTAAAGLLWWLAGHHGHLMHELFARGDHLLFAALVGVLAGRLPLRARLWGLGILSAVVLSWYCGRFATAVVLAASALSFVLVRSLATAPSGPTLLVHASIVGGLYAGCLWMRPYSLLAAIQTFGLLSMMVFRQISVSVALRGGARPTPEGLLCYLTFYPSNAGLLGGPEIYGDFVRRNHRDRPHADPRGVIRRVATGVLQLWLADRLPVSFETVVAASTAGEVWANVLLLYVATALKLMGLWAIIEANALLYGFRLQPNFVGLLTRTNPSELWWAWRSTFTNWLVRYVYSPLGASHHHQVRNVLAVFLVSWAWHAAGIPFLGHDVRLVHLLPISIWAVVNSLALIGYLRWQRLGWTVLPEGVPEPVRRGVKIALTCLLGSFNVGPLLFQGDRIGAFEPVLRLLVGLGTAAGGTPGTPAGTP